METKIIEVQSKANWGKFMVARWDTEWERRSALEGEGVRGPLLRERGWGLRHVWVCDIETGEGAVFAPGGLARVDLAKHRIQVCPLFLPFLEWLYQQDLSVLDALPDLVDLSDAPFYLFKPRESGMHVGHQVMTLAYWRDGRMEVERAYQHECECGAPEAHEEVRWAGAEFVDGSAHQLPRGLKVWRVITGAPTLAEAIDMGRAQARALAAPANPALAELRRAVQALKGGQK